MVVNLASSNFFSEALSASERDLYDRQFRLEGWDQKIIKNSRVLIAGVGGLGCETAKNLAMLGVGHLDLVDLDIIEHSNLNRQILFAGAKMRTSKAKMAAKRLKDVNPYITIEGYHTSLERLDPSIYANADVVVGGLDSIIGRMNLNAQCVRFRKSLVDGGVSGYHGHVYTIMPHKNACFECYPLPSTESDEMAACTVVGVPRKRVHCVFKGVMKFQDEFNEDPNPKNLEHIKYIQKHANALVQEHNFPPSFTEGEVYQIIDRHDPGIITINAVIASLQSHETIKLLHWKAGNKNLGEPVSNYIIFNGMTLKFYAIEKKRNPKCMQCGDQVRRESIMMNTKTPCKEIIETLLRLGYKPDPDYDPIITIMDFNNITEVDLDLTPKQNRLRNLELLTVAGFQGGEIFITLNLT